MCTSITAGPMVGQRRSGQRYFSGAHPITESAKSSNMSLQAELRLRPESRRVKRRSRKMLIGPGHLASIAIAAALLWALDNNRRGNQSATELYNTGNTIPADGLASLPRDYTNISKLGPALPVHQLTHLVNLN